MDEVIHTAEGLNRNIFHYRALAEHTRKSHLKAAEQYYDYLRETGQKEGVESVRIFLNKVKEEKAAATFNLRMQGLKHYLMEKYKNDMKQLFGITHLFMSNY